jgi:hypothetical protein
MRCLLFFKLEIPEQVRHDTIGIVNPANAGISFCVCKMPHQVRHDKHFRDVIQSEAKDPENISLREL